MITPEAIYHEHTSILFQRIDGKVVYYIRKWLNGYNQELMASGLLKTIEQLEKFKVATSFDEVMKIHNLGVEKQ